MALDRIEEIKVVKGKYEESDIDFKEYFEDIIGVSRPIDGQPVKIELIFYPDEAPYVLTKPLHGSQKKIKEDENGLILSIEVIPNYELEKLLLSFGEKVKILKPADLKKKIKTRLVSTVKSYS